LVADVTKMYLDLNTAISKSLNASVVALISGCSFPVVS
jgi:hypothetical protein